VHRGQKHFLVDGGVPCAEPMSFLEVGASRDLLVLDVVRAEEALRRPPGVLAGIDHAARQSMRVLMAQGLDSLRALPRPPRVFRLAPSRILAYKMLDFGE